jgi:hypothetical protein
MIAFVGASERKQSDEASTPSLWMLRKNRRQGQRISSLYGRYGRHRPGTSSDSLPRLRVPSCRLWLRQRKVASDTGTNKSLDSIKRTTKKSIIMSGESTTNNDWIYTGYGSEEEHASYYDVGTPSTYDNQNYADHKNSSTMFDSEDDRRMLVTGMLLAIMVILSMLLCYLVVPLFYDYLRDKIPVSEARKERRYQTIEGWLVSKVRQHDQARGMIGSSDFLLTTAAVFLFHIGADTVHSESAPIAIHVMS